MSELSEVAATLACVGAQRKRPNVPTSVQRKVSKQLSYQRCKKRKENDLTALQDKVTYHEVKHQETEAQLAAVRNLLAEKKLQIQSMVEELINVQQALEAQNHPISAVLTDQESEPAGGDDDNWGRSDDEVRVKPAQRYSTATKQQRRYAIRDDLYSTEESDYCVAVDRRSVGRTLRNRI